jgi:hypothetical protein
MADQENQAGLVQPGQIHGRPVRDRSLYKETSVPSPHSASTLGGDHTFRHRERKHSNEIRRKNRLFRRLAG